MNARSKISRSTAKVLPSLANMKRRSPFFLGRIGATISPRRFAASNSRIDPTRYDYEGNWAFCRFESDEVYGARFGFGRGAFDARDFGAAAPLDPSNLWIHLELMTRDGAVLWIGNGRYAAGQVTLGARDHEARLVAGGREIFRISGWPKMAWHFASDDGALEVSMRCDLENVTILPDFVLPGNWFAMWLAIGRVRGTVRFQNRRTRVHGVVFYDHPRINMQRNRGRPFGWNLYTPMRLSNGARLMGFFSCDPRGAILEDSCYGLYVAANGTAEWASQVRLHELRLDADGKPKSWRSHWKGKSFEAVFHAFTRATSIRKAWGNPSVAQTRKANPNIPLIFDGQGKIVRGPRIEAVTGGGLGEFLVRAGGDLPRRERTIRLTADSKKDRLAEL